MHILYFVRKGENEELRYSLRSLRNLPDVECVWIVGDKPAWVTGVEFLQGNRHMLKSANVYDNLRIACREIPHDELVICNDDFYVTAPVESLPSLHRGLLKDHYLHCAGAWRRSLHQTYRWLTKEGIKAPLSYELHIPVRMDRLMLGEVLERADDGIRPPKQWRTLYGNVYSIESTKAPDVRLHVGTKKLPTPFASSEDGVFVRGKYAAQLEKLFPEASPYER